MAEPFKRDGVWLVKWKDHAGRWHQLRTRARTKAEARRIRDDLERKAERQRLGLEPLPSAAPITTFSELVDLWWRHYGRRLRSQNVKGLVEKHLCPTLAPLSLQDVPSRLEDLFASKDSELSPTSVNYLRKMVHRLYVIAAKRGLWNGPNPAKAIERRHVPRRLPAYLRAEEVPAVLAALAPHQRPLFAAALYTGMRRGELFELTKGNVDLEAGTIAIVRSKGGHADLVPIADDLRPYLVAAIAASPSELVFPNPDGSPRKTETNLARVLRTALGRSGIVEGYVHKCRGRRCDYAKPSASAECGRCPACGKHLWAMPVPRPLRFHDLRHSTATLLLKAGVPFATVQRLLRHTDPRITVDVYGHLDVEDMRAAVNKLSFGPPAVEESEPEAAAAAEPEVLAAEVGSFGAPVVRHAASLHDSSDRPLINPCAFGGMSGRGERIRTSDSLTPSRREPGSTVSPHVAPSRIPSESQRTQPAQRSPGVAPRTPNVTPFGAYLVRPVAVVSPALLTVADVAAQLGVCTATVYKLCARGELPHVRVSNAIRVTPADLSAFIKRKKK